MFSTKLFSEHLMQKSQDDNLSMRKAAKIIGTSTPTLSRLISKKSMPDLKTFNLCCNWMGIPMEFFFL